ncbi:hypothetical protein [Mycolicibacterium sp. lyk4-40-TYG-92]|jgi:hypothetical protein|uniref:hypothetical protein n=1 Tax=Mycolicibacterium sp. lyk4-40-TYG-92 TaxID=3040295 RepID=UPI002551B563|nr:hypothetical protein [Mycolicibacterium sp. lyk4-40-TYG-92]
MSRPETSGITLKWAIGIIGGSAAVGAVAVCAGVLAGPSETTSAGSTLITTSTTAPVTFAAPSITGKAPLYAGQSPDTNPQG